MEIANVVSDGEGGFDFVYLPGESDATTWPGELSAQSDRSSLFTVHSIVYILFCMLPRSLSMAINFLQTTWSLMMVYLMWR